MNFLPYITPRRTFFLLFFTCFVSAVFFSCKKESTDALAPTVMFHSPAASAAFFYGDEIPVSVHVTDDKHIATITVDVINSSNQVFLQEIVYTDRGTEFMLNTALLHSDLYLTTGVYYVRVTADDGNNQTIAYREIYLQAAPQHLLYVYAVHGTPNFPQFDSISGNVSMPVFTPPGYSYGDVDSHTKQLVVCNQAYQSTYNIQLDEGFSAPMIPVVMDAGATFSAFHHDDAAHEFYAGISNGDIWKIGEVSNQLYTQIPGQSVRYLLTTADFFYVITSDPIDLTNTTMHVYHRTTGSFFHSVPIGYDVRGMVLMDSQNKILVVGNDNGNSHFMFYNNETNAMNAVFNFYESSQVSGIWPGDNGSFYVAHTAGIAYYTNYLDQYVINSTLQPSEIHFEHLSGAVYAIVPNDGIHILSQNCGNEIGFVAGSDYFDVLFHYNK